MPPQHLLIKIIKNIFAILSPSERRKSGLLILSDAVISLLDIGSLILILLIVNFYTLPSGVSHLGFLPGTLINPNSVLLITLFGIAFCIKNLLAYKVNRAQYQFVYKVASRLSEKNLQQYFEGSYREQVSVDSSVYIRQISQQPIEFSHYVLASVQQIITHSFLIVLSVTAILIFNAKLFLMLLVLLLPPVIGVAMILKRKTRAARMQSRESSEKSLQHLKEALAGYVESNINGKKQFFTRRYARCQQELNHYLADLQSVQGIPSRLMEIFAITGLFILILINTWRGNESPVGVLTIGMFMAAAYKIIPGIVRILNCCGQIHTFDHTIRDQFERSNIPVKRTELFNTNPINSLVFENLVFSYAQNKLVNGLSFSMNKGDFIGISGNSGTGKTSLVNLLLGFIDPGRGRILINDIPVSSKELSNYWPEIAYVKQEPFLIHDTIVKNITLDEKEDDRGKLDTVIRATGLETLLSIYSEGIHRIIAESGKDISGGQRQRIAISRALYKKASLVILDEPFKELDRRSEELLLNHFKQLAREGKIIILITHHKASLSHCDKIISLDEA